MKSADDYLNSFALEAKEHMEKIESAFLNVSNLADEQANSEMLNGVYREIHSLKGTAGLVSQKNIADVAHALESVFTLVRDGKLKIDEDLTDITLKTVDCLNELIDNVHGNETIDITEIVEELKVFAVSVNGANYFETGEEDYSKKFNFDDVDLDLNSGQNFYCVSFNFNRSLGDFYKNPKLFFLGLTSIGKIREVIIKIDDEEIQKFSNIAREDNENLNACVSAVKEAIEKRDVFDFEALVSSVLEQEVFSEAIGINPKYIKRVNLEALKKGGKQSSALQANPLSSQNAGATSSGGDFSVRLGVNAINNLLDLANEMILTRNQLISSVANYRKIIPGINPVLQNINRLTSEIQEKVMQTRMQSIGTVFNKFPRIVRETAKDLDKEIGVEIFGADVALDKYLLDALTDPVTQLVKNSADHGVESPERRLELGKPRKGLIVLNAYMRDGSAIIEITDDGGGMDLNALREKILEKKLATSEEIEKMDEDALYNMIFEPGFSTAKKVTNLSGRGVGMDIVRTNIEKLGGSIEVKSKVGKGTTIRLKTPLTLSVIRTLIVKIDGVQYAVPEINVERIVRIWKDEEGKPRQGRRFEKVENSLELCLDGRIIPVFSMSEIEAAVLGKAPNRKFNPDEIIKKSIIKCLVLKAGSKSFALLIDEAVETVETLIKSLPVFLKKCDCYSNVTVLGDGSAIAILNADGISKIMNVESVENREALEKASEVQVHEQNEGKKQIIIFKCSGSEYYAVETNDILRIEAISKEQIQKVGDGHFVNVASKSIRVTRLENYVPVQKNEYKEKKLYLITLKKSVSPLGFLASKIVDKAEDVFKLDKDKIISDYIRGTGVFNEKVLIFPNPNAIIEKIEEEKREQGISAHS